ncbi:class I SAM-dependent methyltransferase [Oceanobacillus saliphilus]|uniref:class I SAM-dependent methyltransferase n=1 Tax=Oceanobacillus saliphilus TaxID=2925834 RepID=UPI00201E428E|nr:class I SAM-dependent methyltransferase [Oceanobacillus saliphilus]
MNEKEHVKKVFSKNRKAYVTSSTHSQGEDLQLLKDWLNPTADSILLDIATGGGHVVKQLSPFVKTAFATDITKDMLENTSKHLRDYPNIIYVIADAEYLPFLDHSFDSVTCRIAAHHFPQPSLFIKEVQRVLKPGGSFILIDNIAAENNDYDVYINKLEKMRDYSHVKSLQISKWKELFQKNNLTVTKERIRKKTLPFHEWVNRTLDKKQEIEKVHEFLLHAPEEIKEYYNIKLEHQKVESIAIDEWMVICKK